MADAKTILVLKPRGFCAGVVRAVDAVESALLKFGPPIYVLKEIVHNRTVIASLEARGAVFVPALDQVPEGARVFFSAHGVAPQCWDDARRRGLRVIDATCPLVNKVHGEAQEYTRRGFSIVIIGHRQHDEIIGLLGEVPPGTPVVETVEQVDELQVADPERVAYLTQTTLSLDETRAIIERLRQRFPHVAAPKAQDICYATQNRQTALKRVAPRADLVLVVGSENSSNSLRLVEVAANAGAPAYRIDDADAIDPAWLASAHTVGLTAGASAPESLVQQVVATLRLRFGFTRVEEAEGIDEHVRFILPDAVLNLPLAAPGGPHA
ncbi:MAG TPA: 4-hydroxy-3-methylbut-2-enyl diphosphate reductase [Terriglobales bacterium]|nr:4-hydroxy-3-methylbut-2-enyl diphosphate reductase [Terriglobales bacterium]